jgi:hypothetical protein
VSAIIGIRSKTKQQVRRGVEGFVGDLLRAAARAEDRGYVYRSLHANSFAGEDVGYRAFIQIVDRLMVLGLVERFEGYQRWGEAFGTNAVLRAKASRFRATPKLFHLAAGFGVAVSDVKQHFITDLPKEPLQLRTASSRSYGRKVQGRQMPIKTTPRTKQLEAEVKELNEFFEGFELSGGTHRGYIRVFSEGDVKGFRWNRGGRLYSQGDDNYQLLNEENRLQMTIHSEPVCEIDIKASFPTIYLGRFDVALESDPYGLPDVPRDIAKDWFTATFGSNKHLQRWPTAKASKYRESTGGRELGKNYPVKFIREKVLEKFPVLKSWGEQEMGWAELMYLESEAVVSTMLRLKREHGVPSLSVHDSIIVPASKCEIAKALLTEEYLRITNTKPQLHIERAPSNGSQ